MPAARVGWLVARARAVAGITDRDLASSLGLPLRTVRRWERGDVVPTDDEVEAIAAGCGTRLTELLPRRASVSYDRATGIMRMGDQAVALSANMVDNDSVLGAYIGMVRRVRGLRPDQDVKVRQEDLEALGDALDVDDEELEERLVRVIGMSRNQAAAVRAQLLRRRLAVPMVGMLAGFGLLGATRCSRRHRAGEDGGRWGDHLGQSVRRSAHHDGDDRDPVGDDRPDHRHHHAAPTAAPRCRRSSPTSRHCGPAESRTGPPRTRRQPTTDATDPPATDPAPTETSRPRRRPRATTPAATTPPTPPPTATPTDAGGAGPTTAPPPSTTTTTDPSSTTTPTPPTTTTTVTTVGGGTSETTEPPTTTTTVAGTAAVAGRDVAQRLSQDGPAGAAGRCRAERLRHCPSVRVGAETPPPAPVAHPRLISAPFLELAVREPSVVESTPRPALKPSRSIST
jgi:transcriptional regulator with XRE-family HTH domain